MLANDKLDQLTKKLDQMATAMISMAETINGLSLRSTEKGKTRKSARQREKPKNPEKQQLDLIATSIKRLAAWI